MTVHICRPLTVWGRYIVWCPTCERNRSFVGMHQAWYDPIYTCCGCGDSWSGGQRLPRPFQRGWRPKSIKVAQDRWEDALEGLDLTEALRELMEGA